MSRNIFLNFWSNIASWFCGKSRVFYPPKTFVIVIVLLLSEKTATFPKNVEKMSKVAWDYRKIAFELQSSLLLYIRPWWICKFSLKIRLLSQWELQCLNCSDCSDATIKMGNDFWHEISNVAVLEPKLRIPTNYL